MSELATRFTGLGIGQTYIGFAEEEDIGFAEEEDIPNEVLFCPSGNLATKLQNTPRYLFRVYSDASAGENSSEWMKSVDALKNNLTDIFQRDDTSSIALTLNEHLRWNRKKTNGDPFISWTASLLVAIQYAIYKHKTEPRKLNKIYLCIVDTTSFPSGVFIKDLDLIEEFHDKIPSSSRGLDNLRGMRNTKYYFGEYLSQGQTNINIKSRSCTVPCDKIINNHLFAMMHQFKVDIEGQFSLWANAVIKSREPFYITEQEVMDNSEFSEAMAIALEFDTKWVLPMLANLLALSPRTARDPATIGLILKQFSDEVKDSLSPKSTKIVANADIPEVLEFRDIVHNINKDYYAKSVAVLVKSMEETTDIARRFIHDSRTTGGRKMHDRGNLTGCLPTVDHDHVQPLMQSLDTLSGIIQELQENMSGRVD